MSIENHQSVAPRDEQETVISYQNWDGTWHFYSNCPKHIRKWSKYVDVSSRELDGQNRVVSLDGTITGANVQIAKRRVLSASQREKAAEFLKRAHAEEEKE